MTNFLLGFLSAIGMLLLICCCFNAVLNKGVAQVNNAINSAMLDAVEAKEITPAQAVQLEDRYKKKFDKILKVWKKSWRPE